MQQQRMVVLGLLAIGMRYGFEMEKFAEDTQMRQWTPIGMSTIYKLLKDLAREGAVEATKEPAPKGPPRTAYRLTRKGREAFADLVTEALRSDSSVYSARMAGLVFLPALDRKAGLPALNDADAWLTRADDILVERLAANPEDAVADAVIGFYRDVYAAERKAIAKMKKALSRD